MGLFSSKKKTYVSSVVYNLAGEEAMRPNFLKTAIIGNVISNSGRSVADVLNNSYLNGPGIRLRNFARWADTSGYNDALGIVTGSIVVGNTIDLAVLADEIPHGPDETVSIQSAEIDGADYTYWVDQYMLENHPDLLDTNYISNFNELTNEITIVFADASVETFTPVNYDDLGRYLFVTYNLIGGEVIDPVETGSVITLDPGDPFPDTTGWTLNSLSTTPNATVLTTKVQTVVTYSDGSPGSDDTVTTDEDVEWSEIHGEWERTDYMGQDPITDSIYSVRSIMYQDQVGAVVTDVDVDVTNEDIGGGVIKTTTVTTTTEILELTRTYRIDTQKITHQSRSPTTMLIYKKGDGNATLDAMFAPPESTGEFYPFIPVRLDNEFISESYLPEIYELSKRALRRATTGNFDDIVENVADNENLKDIDYTYVTFGVSLNVDENASRRYVYEFFQTILEDAGLTEDGDYESWISSQQAAEDSVQAWNEWKEAQSDPMDPLYGTPEPTVYSYPQIPTRSIRVASSNNTTMNYDMTIQWNNITEVVEFGLGKPDAKKGELWFEIGADDTYTQIVYTGRLPLPTEIEVSNITLFWQDEETRYRKLMFSGLKHINMIYRGKAVEITAKEALEDAEESGFIIPLHQLIYKQIGLKDGTQMSTACCFLVFNCYKVVKKKWYQSSWFRVLIVIVAIVVTIYMPGAVGASGSGLLGGNAAVGAAIGFSGSTAAIVGAVANAVAAMILVNIVQRGAVALFGDKLGAVIGAIAGIVALQVGTAMVNGASLSSSFGSLMRADNILKLTNAAGKGYMGYLSAENQEIMAKTQDLIEGYNTEAKELQDKWYETFGASHGIIDPTVFTNSTNSLGFSPEDQDSFLSRTLMSGSDVAQMSLDLLSNFVDITLSSEL